MKELTAQIRETDVVVDVGGGAAPNPRADWVVDALGYEERGKLGGKVEGGNRKAEGMAPRDDGVRVLASQTRLWGKRGLREDAERVTRETWVQLDVCARERWPFEDKQFDFALCTHVLEDLRDPIWVCSEISRIAKAGYIEVPSRIVEQSLGVEHPRYAGYYHHRWLVSECDGALEFRFKPHCLHSLKGAIVASVGPWRRISPQHDNLCFGWQGEFGFREVMEFDEAEVQRELCAFAADARKLPDLTAPTVGPILKKLKRQFYYWRQ